MSANVDVQPIIAGGILRAHLHQWAQTTNQVFSQDGKALYAAHGVRASQATKLRSPSYREDKQTTMATISRKQLDEILSYQSYQDATIEATTLATPFYYLIDYFLILFSFLNFLFTDIIVI